MSIRRINLIKIISLQSLMLPLIFNPFSSIPFEIPKVDFFLVSTDIIALISLFYIREMNKKNDLRLLVLEIVYLASIILTSLKGVNFYKSFWGNYWRADGILTLIHLIGISFIFSAFWKINYHKIFIPSVSISGFIVSLIFIIQKIVSFSNIPAATFGNSNFLAGYLLVTLPFSLYNFSASPHKIFWQVNLFLQIMTILLTQSYSAIILLPIALILWLSHQKQTSKKNRLLFYAKTILFLLSLFFTAIYLNHYFQERTKYRGFLPEGRERIYTNAFLAFKERPLSGWGWANFDYAFEKISWPEKWSQDVYVDKAHSLFLEILSTSGIIGFTIFSTICLITLYNLAKDKKMSSRTFLLSFILFLIHSQTNVISINEEYIFWTIVGIAASKEVKNPRPKGRGFLGSI